jgi:hypothetical protein
VRSIKSPKLGDLLSTESLAIESEFTLSKTLKILGEIKSDIPQIEDSEVDYSIQIGPSIEVEDFKIRAYYYRTSPLANHVSQGFFFTLNYQRWRWVSVDINVDRVWSNTKGTNNDMGINHCLFKMSLSLPSSTSLITWTDIVDLNSRENANLHRTTHSYFAELNNKWKSYRTFINYRFHKLDDRVSSYRNSNTNALTFGIKNNWTRNEIWIKGGLTHKEARVEESVHFAGFGFDYNPFDSSKVYFEKVYEGLKSGNNKIEYIRLSGGINFKLPFNMELQNSLRAYKTINGDIDYRFMTSIVWNLNS